jgi:hypothetical protein
MADIETFYDLLEHKKQTEIRVIDLFGPTQILKIKIREEEE